MKNSNNTIGNRTRDLSACSAVPQLTAPPRSPQTILAISLIMFSLLYTAGHSDRSVRGLGLLPLAFWGSGFELLLGYGCLSRVCVVK